MPFFRPGTGVLPIFFTKRPVLSTAKEQADLLKSFTLGKQW